MSSMFTIPISEAVFKTYAITASVLVAKMLFMSPLTSRQRISKNIFANPEDASYFPTKKDGKVTLDDQDVERVRRAHRNDLENIPPYLVISGLYALTNPHHMLAIVCMTIFTVSRMGHSYVYAVRPKPQPARVIYWSIGYGITIFMTCSVFWHFINLI